jgi:hypothetical protein
MALARAASWWWAGWEATGERKPWRQLSGAEAAARRSGRHVPVPDGGQVLAGLGHHQLGVHLAALALQEGRVRACVGGCGCGTAGVSGSVGGDEPGWVSEPAGAGEGREAGRVRQMSKHDTVSLPLLPRHSLVPPHTPTCSVRILRTSVITSPPSRFSAARYTSSRWRRVPSSPCGQTQTPMCKGDQQQSSYWQRPGCCFGIFGIWKGGGVMTVAQEIVEFSRMRACSCAGFAQRQPPTCSPAA